MAVRPRLRLGFPRDWSRSIRLSTRALTIVGVVVLLFLCGLTVAINANARTVRWRLAGASVFGGACEYGSTGYRGDNLNRRWRSFAELGMGRALGGLPYGAKIRVLLHGRKLTIVKRDIGLGGGNVGGLPRSIDLWEGALHALLGYHDCNWTGVVAWRRVQ